jgi:hypothetical protein
MFLIFFFTTTTRLLIYCAMAELSSDRIIDNILDSQLGSERDGDETASRADNQMLDVSMEDPTPGPRRVGFAPSSISKVVDQTANLVMESFDKFLERYEMVHIASFVVDSLALTFQFQQLVTRRTFQPI